uniref:Uncharacterized protein n=1 Tax=Octopus bimaculoides TaxID=37653 RepID=A0A0L8FTA8_OCTBM
MDSEYITTNSNLLSCLSLHILFSTRTEQMFSRLIITRNPFYLPRNFHSFHKLLNNT